MGSIFSPRNETAGKLGVRTWAAGGKMRTTGARGSSQSDSGSWDSAPLRCFRKKINSLIFKIEIKIKAQYAINCHF